MATKLGDLPGSPILAASWTGTALFAVTAAADRLGAESLEPVATFTALGLFSAGFVIWVVAFVIAVARSAEAEISIPGLFFLQGTAPRPVQVQLLGSLLAGVAVAAATASSAPFGVLEPVFPLALAGLWGARHGTFGPRQPRPRRRDRAPGDAKQQRPPGRG